MTLSKEQAQTIKKQLLEQLKNQELSNKEQIISQINQFSPEQLEAFLKKNNIQLQSNQQTQKPEKPEKPQCIFCSIADGTAPSHKLMENKKSVAILELNPLSKGHSIVVPKQHLSIEKLPKTAMGLAQKLSKKIKSKLKPEDIKIETTSFQNHAMINIIPIYKDKKLEKKKANENELKSLQKKLMIKKRAPRKQKQSSIPEISFRIP